LVFPLPKVKLLDFLFAKAFWVVGEGGSGGSALFAVVVGRANRAVDWELFRSVMEPVGVFSEEPVDDALSGRGGGGETLLRG
jgi:hypothetical protein